jgi:hypothetical protein
MKSFLCLISVTILHSLFDIRYSLFVAFIVPTHGSYWPNICETGNPNSKTLNPHNVHGTADAGIVGSRDHGETLLDGAVGCSGTQSLCNRSAQLIFRVI